MHRACVLLLLYGVPSRTLFAGPQAKLGDGRVLHEPFHRTVFRRQRDIVVQAVNGRMARPANLARGTRQEGANAQYQLVLLLLSCCFGRLSVTHRVFDEESSTKRRGGLLLS